jgi:hypothetical protein
MDMYGAGNGSTGIYGGTCSRAWLCGIYMYTIIYSVVGTPADGGHPGGQADPPGGRHGTNKLSLRACACATGKGGRGMRREPQRGGREDAPAVLGKLIAPEPEHSSYFTVAVTQRPAVKLKTGIERLSS